MQYILNTFLTHLECVTANSQSASTQPQSSTEHLPSSTAPLLPSIGPLPSSTAASPSSTEPLLPSIGPLPSSTAPLPSSTAPPPSSTKSPSIESYALIPPPFETYFSLNSSSIEFSELFQKIQLLIGPKDLFHAMPILHACVRLKKKMTLAKLFEYVFRFISRQNELCNDKCQCLAYNVVLALKSFVDKPSRQTLIHFAQIMEVCDFIFVFYRFQDQEFLNIELKEFDKSYIIELFYKQKLSIKGSSLCQYLKALPCFYVVLK